MSKKRVLFTYNNAILFLLILAIFIILKSSFTPPGGIIIDLEQEAEIVLDKLTNGNDRINLLSENELLEERVIELHEMDYDKVKEIIGVEKDFCIFFEDISGNLIKIDNINSGIGSGKIYVNGNPCK